MSYRLLDTFRATFEGKRCIHRDSSLGDFVAMQLYEDLYSVGKSALLRKRIDEKERVLNAENRRRGIKARRGEGTFGELIPMATPIDDPGFKVSHGPVATVEISIEVKTLAKAMMKQMDRVIGDFVKQSASSAAVPETQDEFLILRYRATNAEPYPFSWVDLKATELDYGAILTRISHEYDRRFKD